MRLSFLLLLSACSFGLVSTAEAQCTKTPKISYAGVQTSYKVGNLITPLTPANSGDPVNPGLVSTLAGSAAQGSLDGTGGAASFSFPTGLATDLSGNVYVADNSSHKVRKITPAGVTTTLAGSGYISTVDGTGAAASFKGPYATAVDGSGNVFVADYPSGLIRKITPAGVVTTYAGAGFSGFIDGPAATARFNDPLGLAVDASGNVFVADQQNNCIRKITSAGIVSTFVGTNTAGFTDGTGAAARFNHPVAVALDAAGNIYVVDYGNHSIRKASPAGVVTTVAGTGMSGFANGTGTAASFSAPTGIAVDASGNLFVADDNNHRIRKITPAGVVTTFSGSGVLGYLNGPSPLSKYDLPHGVAVDGAGNVYVADQDNNSIRKISPEMYSISPSLPAGMAFSNMTGVISGTPTVVTPSTKYTIRTQNDCGVDSTSITFATISNVGVINTNIANAITLYPNPTSSIVHISAPIPVSVSVVDMDGRKVIAGKATNELNLGALADGVYRVVVRDMDGNILKSEKISKVVN